MQTHTRCPVTPGGRVFPGSDSSSQVKNKKKFKKSISLAHLKTTLRDQSAAHTNHQQTHSNSSAAVLTHHPVEPQEEPASHPPVLVAASSSPRHEGNRNSRRKAKTDPRAEASHTGSAHEW